MESLVVSTVCFFVDHLSYCFVASANEFKPSWSTGSVSSIPSFTPSFNMGNNPGFQQPTQPAVRTIGKSKPLTLNALGAGKIGYSGSKSLSAAAPTPAPAPVKSEPTPAPAPAASVETPKPVEKKEEKIEEPVQSPETPVETVEESTPSAVLFISAHLTHRLPI